MAGSASFPDFPVARCGGGAPPDDRTLLADILHGARGALRAGREIERLTALTDLALAREGLTRDDIVARALRLHLGD